MALRLRIAESLVSRKPDDARREIAEASEELAHALEELREIARGLHPAILSDHGLAAGVHALAGRAPIPVEVRCELEGKPPAPIEAAAYYVVAEALTNVAKYARASGARVSIERTDARLRVQVADDGVGGAAPAAGGGSGLRGLADRVEALGGRLEVDSEPGQGTTVRAELPLAHVRGHRRPPRRGRGEAGDGQGSPDASAHHAEPLRASTGRGTSRTTATRWEWSETRRERLGWACVVIVCGSIAARRTRRRGGCRVSAGAGSTTPGPLTSDARLARGEAGRAPVREGRVLREEEGQLTTPGQPRGGGSREPRRRDGSDPSGGGSGYVAWR